MRKKVIDSIKEELDLFNDSGDEKHLYTTEKLIQLLKNNKKEIPEEKTTNKKQLDDTYIADSSSSIFDF